MFWDCKSFAVSLCNDLQKHLFSSQWQKWSSRDTGKDARCLFFRFDRNVPVRNDLWKCRYHFGRDCKCALCALSLYCISSVMKEALLGETRTCLWHLGWFSFWTLSSEVMTSAAFCHFILRCFVSPCNRFNLIPLHRLRGKITRRPFFPKYTREHRCNLRHQQPSSFTVHWNASRWAQVWHTCDGQRRCVGGSDGNAVLLTTLNP